MDLCKTDFEFMERYERFAFDEVVHEEGQELPEHTRYLAILATLIGCGGLDAYKEMLPIQLHRLQTIVKYHYFLPPEKEIRPMHRSARRKKPPMKSRTVHDGSHA